MSVIRFVRGGCGTSTIRYGLLMSSISLVIIVGIHALPV
jgi:Flp pilus assembly pilin Flp